MYWNDYYSGETSGRAYRDDVAQRQAMIDELWDTLPENDPAWDLLNPQTEAYRGEGGWGQKGMLDPEDWLHMLNVTRDANLASIEAGRRPEWGAAGTAYGHTPEEAKQERIGNANQFAWEDEWAKRLSTPDFDPRFAQQATTFAPNQFNAQANAYFDPFLDEGPLGGLRERMRSTGPTEQVNPLFGEPYNYRASENLVGKTVVPGRGIPERPKTLKGMEASLKEWDETLEEEKTKKTELAKARQRAIANQETIDAADKKRLDDLLTNPMYKDPKGFITDEAIANYILRAQLYNTTDWKEAFEISGNDPVAAKKRLDWNFRMEHQPGYKEAWQKEQADKAAAEELARTKPSLEGADMRPSYLGMPVTPEVSKRLQVGPAPEGPRPLQMRGKMTPMKELWKFRSRGPKQAGGRTWPKELDRYVFPELVKIFLDLEQVRKGPQYRHWMGK